MPGVSGANLEIVSAISGFLAARRDEDAHLGLIRSLILGKARVPVDPPGAVSGHKGADCLVEFADSPGQFDGQPVDLRLRGQIPLLIGLEPLPVVVLRQVLEKLDDFFQILID